MSLHSLGDSLTNSSLLTLNCMELSLYRLCTDSRENSLPIVGTECLLNNSPATASYIIARTVESSPRQRCREVFTATLCSNQHAAARPGSARHSTARHGEDTALTIHFTLLYPFVDSKIHFKTNESNYQV
jgi:hypothetical protein